MCTALGCATAWRPVHARGIPALLCCLPAGASLSVYKGPRPSQDLHKRLHRTTAKEVHRCIKGCWPLLCRLSRICMGSCTAHWHRPRWQVRLHASLCLLGQRFLGRNIKFDALATSADENHTSCAGAMSDDCGSMEALSGYASPGVQLPDVTDDDWEPEAAADEAVAVNADKQGAGAIGGQAQAAIPPATAASKQMTVAKGSPNSAAVPGKGIFMPRAKTANGDAGRRETIGTAHRQQQQHRQAAPAAKQPALRKRKATSQVRAGTRLPSLFGWHWRSRCPCVRCAFVPCASACPHGMQPLTCAGRWCCGWGGDHYMRRTSRLWGCAGCG